jgi:putative methyltransferase (TIGR04325 family)
LAFLHAAQLKTGPGLSPHVDRRDIQSGFRTVIREIVPPGVLRLVRRFRKTPVAATYGHFGDYQTFEAAMADCPNDGYLSANIIQAVSEQTIELKRRLSPVPASVLVDGRTSQNLAAVLVATSELSAQRLSVLDFGGGLGLHYHQLKPFLGTRGQLSWLVWETGPMAEEGNRRFASEELRFVPSLDQAQGPFDLLLASGAIQYVRDPVGTLARLSGLSDHMVLNRLPLVDSERDRLAVQRVDPTLFAATLPIWFFSERRWLAKIDELGFEVAMRWEVPQDTITLDGAPVVFQGLLARRRRR